MSRGGLPILTYHAIDRSGAVTATTPALFAETLGALQAGGFQAVDLADWIARGRPPVAKGYALTFDDGLCSILDVAEMLIEASVPATVFLVSNRIGRDNAWPGQPRGVPLAATLGRADLAALGRMGGFRFGSHGQTHARLDRLAPGPLASELTASRDAVEQAVGQPCPLVAYPYGTHNSRVRAAAAQVYEAAFGTRLDYASAADAPFALARIDAFYLRSRQARERLVADRWRGRLAIRRALRAGRRAVMDFQANRFPLRGEV